jgi:signal transduction histidine kinase
MTPEALAKIWQPFFTTRASGRGPGLAVPYRIIREHGGVVGAQSAPGRGTTGTIVLPLQAAP